jgi:hypothetical protein
MGLKGIPGVVGGFLLILMTQISLGEPMGQSSPALLDVGQIHINISFAQEVNHVLFPNISTLVKTPYFRYIRLDLDKTCPFWKDNPQCLSRDCAVQYANLVCIDSVENESKLWLDFYFFTKGRFEK